MMRRTFGMRWKRARLSSSRAALREREAGFFCAMPSLVLPLGDEARRCPQNIALRAEWRKRCVRLLQKILQAALGAGDAKLGDEGGLAERCGLSGRFAECCCVTFDVEQIVGDLERLAERVAVSIECRVLFLGGLTEQRARDAAIFQKRAGLHLLELGDIRRFLVAEAAFACEIHDLATGHAADPGRARQRPR